MGVRYTGNDYREFLRLVLQDRRLLQRDLAAMMERSPAWASQILSGKRRLQVVLAEQMAEVLELDDTERWELLRLVDQATLPMPPLQRRQPPGDDPPPSLERWYVGAIAELAQCDQYEPDPLWVSAALRPRIEVEEAREAMLLLRRLGTLDADFRAAGGHDRKRRGVRSSDRATKKVFELSLDALRESPPNDRSHLTGSVALSEEAYERLQGRMKQAIKTLLATEPGDVPNRIYQVSLATFPISLYSDAAAHPSEVED